MMSGNTTPLKNISSTKNSNLKAKILLMKEHFNAFASLKKKNLEPTRVKSMNFTIKMERQHSQNLFVGISLRILSYPKY
jgi:hypothetical protein